MAKRGRKPKIGYRTASGQLSRRPQARPDMDDGLVMTQPHRAPFATLLDASAARSQFAATALGRLYLIGLAEEKHGIDDVRRALFPARPRGIASGIAAADYMAALEYAAAVGRERWVRAAPKDKPSAIAFMTARGVDLSGRELSDAEARRYIEQFEDNRAVLMAAPCSEDFRRVLRALRDKVWRMARGGGAADAGDVLRQLRGLGALVNPQASAAVRSAVDAIVIDDRDPGPETLAHARIGFRALADFHFGGAQQRAGRTRMWGARPHDASLKPGDDAGGDAGGWKGRHRSLAG